MNRQFNASGYNQHFFQPAPQTFADYQQRCRQMIQHVRSLTHYCPQAHYIDQVSPYQLGTNNSRRGLLLLHGLLETPFLLRDVANHFATRGYLVRSILLPGHATCPGDLLNIHHQAWQQACDYGIASLRQEVDELYLCGYSTGALLALLAGYQPTNNVNGLILFAPAIKIRHYPPPLVNLLRGVGHVIPRLRWLNRQPENDFARYRSLPLNSAYQVYQLSRQFAHISKNRPLDLPLFVVATADDAVVCPRRTVDFFQQQPHPDNHLLLYRRHPTDLADDNLTEISSHYPTDNIDHFSHICLSVAPENSHYGKQGDCPIVINDNRPLRYGELRHRHVSHRLSYNPHFHALMTKIDSFLNKISL